jgi:septum site-determining protein MinD
MARIICIISAKGGAGKTLLANNLAVSLGLDQAKKTCLVDLDLHVVGDMSKMMGLIPKKSMLDLAAALKEEGENVNKKAFITDCSSFGIDFLPAVLKPQEAALLSPESLNKVFALLDKNYDYIIIEAGNVLSDIFVATLNQANLILSVVTPDILSIYQTKWSMETLESLHFPLKMVRIILNRAESTSSISWQEVRISLPVDIIARIPSDGKVVGQSTNRGIPVVIDNPKTKFSLAIKKLSSFLVSEGEELFVLSSTLDKLNPQELSLEKEGQFWSKHGISDVTPEGGPSTHTSEVINLKRRIYSRLIEDLNLKKMDLQDFSDIKKMKGLRSKAEGIAANILLEEAGSFITSTDSRRRLIKEILDEALGLGPLEELIADASISDILVNNKDEVYVERNGKIELTKSKFISNDQVRTIIERIIAPLGKRIDESTPMVDARLSDGSRINAIIPPLSLTGPTLTIRKFKKEIFDMNNLVSTGTLSANMGEFLKACVLARKNIIISGGTGSGKTTTLNIISEFIPESERIITIEDAAELQLHQEHWVRLEPRPANVEGRGEISIRELFRNTLRMRPDRIIIGECRGVETLDMLQAMNTGHDGSMTTIHANSTHDVLGRLDSMILMGGIELPIRAIHEMIVSAINLVIQLGRLSDGSRKVLQITEIAGMKDDIHIDIKDIFLFQQTEVNSQGKVLGEFRATGYIPTFLESMKTKGVILPPSLFQNP